MILGEDAQTSAGEAPLHDEVARRERQSLVRPWAQTQTAREEGSYGELEDCIRAQPGRKKGVRIATSGQWSTGERTDR